MVVGKFANIKSLQEYDISTSQVRSWAKWTSTLTEDADSQTKRTHRRNGTHQGSGLTEDDEIEYKTQKLGLRPIITPIPYYRDSSPTPISSPSLTATIYHQSLYRLPPYISVSISVPIKSSCVYKTYNNVQTGRSTNRLREMDGR
jgi:hypothetical protein